MTTPLQMRSGLTLAMLVGLLDPASAQTLRFDFQPASGPLQPGYTAVTASTPYSPAQGYGFVAAPTGEVDGSGKTWNIFGRIVTVDQAIPPSLLSDATRDGVGSPSPSGDDLPFSFRTDLPPGDYDLTLWLGDVTTPRFRMLATANGTETTVTRADINDRRGSFDQTQFGGVVPRRLRVDASGGSILITIGRDNQARTDPIFGALAANGAASTWTFDLDESTLSPPDTVLTKVLVPAFRGAALQALTISPATDPPLLMQGGQLVLGDAPADPALLAAIASFNQGDLATARNGFASLAPANLQAAAAAGLLWVAGHPAWFSGEVLDQDGEQALIDAALLRLDQLLAADPDDAQAAHLHLQAAMASDAEGFRRKLGYASVGSPAVENLGRSAALAEQFEADHPYARKGQILWLRNRGGLDPLRNSVSFERAQWNAQQLDPIYGAVNPYIHLYATDQWVNDGAPWTRVDWNQIFTSGPGWARLLASNLNSWLDLFEWWTIHRQSPEGDIGGGWTDDVEILPAFGAMALTLPDSSDLTRLGFQRFSDGIWNSPIVDPQAGFQAQFADIEHVAEPTGNLLHVSALLDYGDPERIERMLKSERTFRDLFLSDPADSPFGHQHFLANMMSSTSIAAGGAFAADLPLSGRATNPFPFLIWYAANPGATAPLEAWARSWLEDAQRSENGKPVGIFPNAVWTPTDGIGLPPDGNWWGQDDSHGQSSALPKYQWYPYSLTGFFHTWTGDPAFLAPFDAIQNHTAAWFGAGQPVSAATPPAGQENIWAGGVLKDAAVGAITNTRLLTGTPINSAYLNNFASGYAQLLLNPTSSAPLASLQPPADKLIARWPYKTTEGVMTDRILEPGWTDVISYYIGADVLANYYGMPAQAVSWGNTTRLFAAAVTLTGPDRLDASLYLFSPATRSIDLRLWQLRPGFDYLLEAGPAAGLGLAPSPVAESIQFNLVRRGDAVSFELPGNTAYALRIRPRIPLPAASLPPAPQADLGIHARDLAYDPGTGTLSARVHNIGAVDLSNVTVAVHDGPDSSAPLLASQTLTALAAPLDLTPRFADLVFPGLVASSGTLTASLTPAAGIDEVSIDNNWASIATNGAAAVLEPPMIFAIDPPSTTPGASLTLSGKQFEPGMAVLDAGVPAAGLMLTVIDAQTAQLQVPVSQPAPATLLLSLVNSAGLESNVLPVTVNPLADAMFADGFED